MTIQDSLRHLTALSHFSLEQLEKLSRAAEVLRAPAAEVVVGYGEETHRLHGLVKGTLAAQRSTPHGDFVLGRLRSGELFGEPGLVDRQPRSSDIVAAADCDLVRFGAEALDELCAADRSFDLALHWALWISMSRKLRITTRMLGHFFAGHQNGATPTTVGPAGGGKPIEVLARAKRDLFLEQELSNLEANFLASLSTAERIPAGRTIFREGEPAEKLYFVHDGEVRISRTLPGAGEEALAILKRGEVFGEMSLVDGRPRIADAVAHEGDVDLLTVPSAVVSRLLDVDKLSSPLLLKMFCRTLSRRLRSLDDKIVGWFLLSGGDSTVIGTSPVATRN